MTDDRLKSLIDETAKELDNIMDVTMAQVAKDVVKKAIGRGTRSKDPMFWPAGMLMVGLATAMTVIGKQDAAGKEDESYKKANKAMEAHLDLWKNKYGGRLSYIDDSLAGYSVIRLYEQSHDPLLREIIDKINAYVMDAPTDYAGSIIYSPGRGNNKIFADGIGQSTMFMAAYIRMKMIVQDLLYNGQNNAEIHYYSESDYLNEIGKLYIQFVNYYKYGRDEKSGLIYHGYSLVGRSDIDYDSVKTNAARIAKEYTAEHECDKHGLLGWGRAVGWLMMGLSESASLEKYLEQKGKKVAMKADFSLVPWYIELCETVMDYQREDGGWSWQIQAVEGHIDTSATGMIAYALAKGITDGLFEISSGAHEDECEGMDANRLADLRERVKASLERAVECMLKHAENGVVTDALSACDDFGVHYQSYGKFPWGQGAVLAAMAATVVTGEPEG